ncbi:MAG: TetR family transcriptional regulator C-terminal domain-containing protein, partial [Chloroflexota bacterium]|nr:TetR family transcriptional regulator C-terminal domain-containing protein [Chloroflexota bacterium]
ATILQASFAQLQGFVSGEIQRVQEAGDTQAGLDSERETLTLLALLDGLTVQVLAGQYSAETALAVLDFHLDHLFAAASTRIHVSPD